MESGTQPVMLCGECSEIGSAHRLKGSAAMSFLVRVAPNGKLLTRELVVVAAMRATSQPTFHLPSTAGTLARSTRNPPVSTLKIMSSPKPIRPIIATTGLVADWAT